MYSHESESSEVQFREFRRKYSAGCIRRVLAATRSFFVPPPISEQGGITSCTVDCTARAASKRGQRVYTPRTLAQVFIHIYTFLFYSRFLKVYFPYFRFAFSSSSKTISFAGTSLLLRNVFSQRIRYGLFNKENCLFQTYFRTRSGRAVHQSEMLCALFSLIYLTTESSQFA